MKNKRAVAMFGQKRLSREVFYFKNGVATISSFTHEPKVIKF